jgi:hypothetical protein
VSLLAPGGGVTVVRAGETIAGALERAAPGTTIIVEPGEYRERLALKDGVRVISRVPRAATIRLPGIATEREAAVVATGVANAELSGFRIVGDAATPLGVGVLVSDGGVRLVDLAVSGATSAALDLGGRRPIAVIGSEIHDNPGAAAIIRTGADVRIAANTFQKNAFSERALSAIVIEPDGKSEWSRNVFYGMGTEAITGADSALRASLPKANLFIGSRPATARPPAGRGGRGQ